MREEEKFKRPTKMGLHQQQKNNTCNLGSLFLAQANVNTHPLGQLLQLVILILS